MIDTPKHPPFFGVIGLQNPVQRQALVRQWGERPYASSPYVLGVGVILSHAAMTGRPGDFNRFCPSRPEEAAAILGNDPGVLRVLHYIDDSPLSSHDAVYTITRAINACGPDLRALQFHATPSPLFASMFREMYPDLRIIYRIGAQEIKAARAWVNPDKDGALEALTLRLLNGLGVVSRHADDVLLDWWLTDEGANPRLEIEPFARALRDRQLGLGVAIGGLDAGSLRHDRIEPLFQLDPPLSFQGMDRLRDQGLQVDAESAGKLIELAAWQWGRMNL